jgi:glycosyltransferase involved in cell wall biosynthesis
VKPRVLFVSRERVHLPLVGAQKRKWDALDDVLEPRVIAAAPRGGPTRDARFRLVRPAVPHRLDGALYYALLPFRIARELRDFRPDAAIVQGVHETTAFLLARRLAHASTPVALEIHGDWRHATRLYGSRLRALLNPLGDALGPFAIRRADAVRTISQQTTALVRGAGREPAAVFPAYIDIEAFAGPRAPLPERPSVVYVGVLERIKAFDTLAAAWPLVAERVPGASLRIVGDGTLAPLASSMLGDVEWDRVLPPEGVAAAIDASWLLVLPSRSEGLGRVLLEAAARGRALVGARTGGIPDVVQPEENGLLVEPGDVHGLAHALVRILSDRAEAERLGTGALRTGAEWRATPEEYAARVAALVRGLHAG